MKKRIAAIIIAPIIGAFLGYLLVYALNNGWFKSKWQMIEKPPGEALHLVAQSQDSLWVQSDTGTIYYNENSSTCKSDCWREVPEIPALPIVAPNESTMTSEACAPSPPLSRVTEKISECWSTMWVDTNFTFALRKDGSIYLWQADIFKEWAVVLLFSGICFGAIALFVPTLVYVLVLGFLDRRSKRANKNTGREDV
jgi:phosphate/sulfate permease